MKATWFRQKILAGMISSTLVVLWFMGEHPTWDDFCVGYTVTSAIVLTYGLFASFASDWLSGLLTKNRLGKHIISGFLHCAAGMLLWFLGAIAAVTFFIIDRILMFIPLKWLYLIILGVPSVAIWIYTIFKFYI